jgi:hypothetical protein
MGGRVARRFELPVPARLAHDLIWARATLTGCRPRLDDLEEADRLAALLIARWEPRRTRPTRRLLLRGRQRSAAPRAGLRTT